MYQTNSPCQYQKKCEEKSVENFNNNVGVQRIDEEWKFIIENLYNI